MQSKRTFVLLFQRKVNSFVTEALWGLWFIDEDRIGKHGLVETNHNVLLVEIIEHSITGKEKDVMLLDSVQVALSIVRRWMPCPTLVREVELVLLLFGSSDLLEGIFWVFNQDSIKHIAWVSQIARFDQIILIRIELHQDSSATPDILCFWARLDEDFLQIIIWVTIILLADQLAQFPWEEAWIDSFLSPPSNSISNHQ
jgi:hypothetical protein